MGPTDHTDEEDEALLDEVLAERPDDEIETPLTGGIANQGAVVRVGPTVRRPRKPQSETVQAFLEHLQHWGVSEVPYPFGFDLEGREVLGFIEGVAPEQPFPHWVTELDLLRNLAEVQRKMHAAAADFVPPANAVWGTGGDYFPAEAAGDLVCHNDLGIGNVVIGNGRIRGIIDFDYAHPVNPMFDIAVAIRHWLPMAPTSGRDPAWGDDDALIPRFRAFCEVHELDADERSSVIDLAVAFLDQARGNIARLAESGHAGFRQLIDSGYLDRNLATVDWVRARQRSLVDQ